MPLQSRFCFSFNQNSLCQSRNIADKIDGPNRVDSYLSLYLRVLPQLLLYFLSSKLGEISKLGTKHRKILSILNFHLFIEIKLTIATLSSTRHYSWNIETKRSEENSYTSLSVKWRCDARSTSQTRTTNTTIHESHLGANLQTQI